MLTLRRVKSISEGKNTEFVFIPCAHSVSSWKTLLSCYHKRTREQLSVYLVLTVVLGQTECFWKRERRSVTVREAMIQLEQLLRCNKEEEGGSESEGAVLVRLARWRRIGLPPAEVSPQLRLYHCSHRSGPGHVAKLSSAWSSSVQRINPDPRTSWVVSNIKSSSGAQDGFLYCLLFSGERSLGS